jgi:hypothetical protein
MLYLRLLGEGGGRRPTGAEEQHRGGERCDTGGFLAHGGGGGGGVVGSVEAGGGGGGGGRGDEAGGAAGVVVGELELRPPELRLATVGGDAWLTALAEASACVPLVDVCAAELLAGGRGVPGMR